ncbi:hypothetical protein L21SP3_00973 [Sedimentisphaera cyanobacteriorum]|uniref:HEPN domain protein n=2 Tax=Sedimentisphaera cyanobacteriorum TaxID=1940790 RepID=A0A1Q2HPL6_9BACT|nr:hypothetical protein L21SP3_00973 [Sedimentisphaera cyanobacteriorum]
MAFENARIPKTHNLVELYELVSDCICISDADVLLLAKATKFYVEERYPIGGLIMPDRTEIANILALSKRLHINVINILCIDSE